MPERLRTSPAWSPYGYVWVRRERVIPPGSYVKAMYADSGADRSCRLLRKTPGAVRVWYAAGRPKQERYRAITTR